MNYVIGTGLTIVSVWIAAAVGMQIQKNIANGINRAEGVDLVMFILAIALGLAGSWLWGTA